ncbi:predicted protein [Uncinocarpus reesii 1704]|uniref:Mid2 domain-containing protein n=1 Tax=Uncinocarpus reesii (strain UAMH 1704) TaxID=336963 RepID=C4JXD8_UNCRE|nr:uncharacterized protein UREG_06311 [Uncinocarpus reesii 1704]EEP81446.1 predicted protein [Uncinocarpus reesii 1704]
MTIYQTFSPNAPFVRDLFCWNGWTAFTIFEKVPATTATSSTVAESLPTATSGATVTSLPSATATPPPSEPDADDDSNKAWIAGAVVGPIAACALIGALGFWIGRRRNRSPAHMPLEDSRPVIASGHGYYEAKGSSPQSSGHHELADAEVAAPIEMEASAPKPQPPYYQ